MNNEIDDIQTLSKLQEQIRELQKEIQRVYSEELFNARVQSAYLERDVATLKKENEYLRSELKKFKLASLSYHDNGEYEEDEDWYTSHGHGD